MTWILVAVIVIVIYNAEKLPRLIEHFKNEVPNMVDAGKKVSQDLKEKAKEKVAAKKEKQGNKTDKND